MSPAPAWWTRPRLRTPSALAAVVALLLLNVAGCGGASSSSEGDPSSAPSTAAGEWPRTVTSEKGDVTIESKPERIVSTSLTLTGTLLAINAPVIASGATSPNTPVSDEQGFFTQWSDVAKERGVKQVYSNNEPSVEAVLTEEPDLIIVSATGGDSAIELYDQFAKIAPTLVIGYDDKSWQELAALLGEATGHEADAEAALEDFSAQVDETESAISLPPQPTSAFVYSEDGTANLWTPESAQGKLLSSVGFEIAKLPEAVERGTSMGKRGDIIELGSESIAEGLNGETFVIITPDKNTRRDVLANKLLGNSPAVQEGHVYAMGADSFRLDYYSAGNMLTALRDQLGS